jgi:hypothetical protein
LSIFVLFQSYRGRLDKLLYVPLPTPDDRVSILKALSGAMSLSPDVDLNKIGRSARAVGYSGADCAALLREAGLAVLKEDVGSGDAMVGASLSIHQRHFIYAFNHVVPSVSERDQARYDRVRDRMARARTRGAVASEGELEDEHIEVTIDAQTTDAVIGEGSQLSNPSEKEGASSNGGGGGNDDEAMDDGALSANARTETVSPEYLPVRTRAAEASSEDGDQRSSVKSEEDGVPNGEQNGVTSV